MRLAVFLLFIAAVAPLRAQTSPPPTTTDAPPPTSKVRVTDVYHNVTVTEDYRWLENADDPAVRQWTKDQNAYARNVLDNLPDVDGLREQVRALLSADTVQYSGIQQQAGVFFATKLQPPKQQPFIIRFPSLDKVESAQVIVDPNELDPSGGTSFDWYRISPTGQHIAVSLSSGGSESGDLAVFEIAIGKELEPRIVGVNSGTAGGSLAWLPDGTGFFYTRHFPSAPEDPTDHNVYQQVYFHAMGTPYAADRYELGEGFPRIAEIQLTSHAESGNLLATVQQGDGGEFAHYLRSGDGRWRQFSEFGDGVKQVAFGHNNDLFVVSLKDAPRGRILRVPIDTLDVAGADTLIAEQEDTIVTGGVPFWGDATVLPSKDRLYVIYQTGGLLMGATLTQHPAKMRAVIALVGIYDMLRVELSPNGAFNVPEFGSVEDPQQFAALRAYSPYHNVVDGIQYPAVLFITGENDPRVDPMQSRKMTARLQAATASGHPILLRTSANAGHGRGNSLSQRIEQAVDLYGFLFHELGVSR